MNIDITPKQQEVIERVKSEFSKKLSEKDYAICEEVIEALGYACTQSLTKLPSGEMNKLQWEHYAQTISIKELQNAVNASYSYTGADDRIRIRYILGALTKSFYNRPDFGKPSQKNIIHSKPKNAPTFEASKPNPKQKKNKTISTKEKTEMDVKTAVIKVCIGGNAMDVFYGGAALYISGYETFRISKQCNYHNNPTKATQYSIAIECVEKICELIEGKYNKLVLYEKSCIGFNKSTGNYKERTKTIRDKFDYFETHEKASEAVELDKIVRTELINFPLDKFKITDENTIENPFVELRQIFADLSDEEQVELVNYARAIAARHSIPEISEEQKRA